MTAKTSKLKVGVVGVGHLGSQHSRIYGELARDGSEVEFVGVFDTAEVKAKTIQQKYGGKIFNNVQNFFFPH